MIGGPRPESFRLRDAPLVQALVQVKFPLLARLETLAGVAPVQERLMTLFPYMNQQKVTELQLNMSPSGMTPQTSMTTVTEFTDDEGWRLSLGPGEMTLTAGSSYAGVDGIIGRLAAVLSALHDGLGIRRCERLGVRFLNVVDVMEGEEWAWTEWFRAELAGWVTPQVLASGTRLLATISETRLARSASADVPGEVQSVVRHGFLPAGSVLPMVGPGPLAQPSFLLDLDVFLQAPQRFDPEVLLEQFQNMHSDIEGFFYWSLTDSGKEHFGLEHID